MCNSYVDIEIKMESNIGLFEKKKMERKCEPSKLKQNEEKMYQPHCVYVSRGNQLIGM